MTPTSQAQVRMSSGLKQSLGSAMQLALTHCRQQFRWERWNCPEASFFRRERQVATRETAYVNAIMAAGVVYSVARSCSRGDLEDCYSDPARTPPAHLAGRARWEAMPEDVTHGEKVSQQYLRSRRKDDWSAAARAHNTAVGRTAVEDTMVRACKCHGVSGSCSMKTCWKKMVEFGSIASTIHRHYKHAVKIGFEWGVADFALGNGGASSSGQKISEAKIKHLVYLQESPNYCYPNSSTGWPGTRGRTCSRPRGDNATAEERRSCRRLCRSCGYRVHRVLREVRSACNCSFQWCCQVSCSTCTSTVHDLSCQ
ncbi:protein Wnt-8b-like [Bacillus rossius redtenbacheri]|uniref:protein Wnt-8b-like n=1 Tax=Bacillus rossius redtenbacheri TaxID=93214 RepID=UPI002FDDEDC3